VNKRLRLSLLALCFLLIGAGPLQFSRYNGLDYLEFLGLPRDFSEAQLKTAYRNALMRAHPDRGGSGGALRFVIEANGVLKDLRTRKLFYKWLERQASDPGALPVKSLEEIRRENLSRIAHEIFSAALKTLRQEPKTTDKEMAAIARTLILHWAREFKGQMAGVPELADLMEGYVLSPNSGATFAPRLALALGVIELLKRLAPRGYEEGAEAREYLDRLQAQLESDIRYAGNHPQRMFLDRIFEILTGRSILKAPPTFPAVAALSTCEAILKYEQASGLSVEAPIRVDIRF
jgi:hypothetical protein